MGAIKWEWNNHYIGLSTLRSFQRLCQCFIIKSILFADWAAVAQDVIGLSFNNKVDSRSVLEQDVEAQVGPDGRPVPCTMGVWMCV